MEEILEILTMFIKIMFSGAGAVVAVMVFCVVTYLAAMVIKSAIQAALQGETELLIKRHKEKDKTRNKGRRTRKRE